MGCGSQPGAQSRSPSGVKKGNTFWTGPLRRTVPVLVAEPDWNEVLGEDFSCGKRANAAGSIRQSANKFREFPSKRKTPRSGRGQDLTKKNPPRAKYALGRLNSCIK